MSTPNKTTNSPNNVRFWVLSLFILLILSVAFTFIYRERIIVSVTNHFSTNYGVNVEQLNGLTIQFDMQQPFFIEKVTLEQLKLNVDYLQFEQATQGKANQTGMQRVTIIPTLPELPDWIPDLHISNITVQGSNLPSVPDLSKEQTLSWSKLNLNQLDFKAMDFRYVDSNPEFGFSVWLQEQRLLQAKFNYVLKDISNIESSNTDGNKLLKAQVTTNLTKVNSILSRVLPEFNTMLSGIAKIDVELDPQQIDHVGLRFSLTDAGLSHGKQKLIANTHLSVDTELVLDSKGWLPEQVNLNITNIDPITLSANNCLQLTALFNMENSVCQLFNKDASPKLAPVAITPELPLSLQVSIQERDIDNWQVQAKQLAMTVSMSENRSQNSLAVKADKLLLTPQSWQSNWAFSIVTNSRYFSDMNVLDPVPLQVESDGHIDVNPAETNTKLTLKNAKVTAQKFKYTDMSSEDITVTLLAPMTVSVENDVVLPFDFALSTVLFNNQYQQEYKLDTLTAQHRGHFSSQALIVGSDWQLDDVVLKSKNTVRLLNLTPNKVEGYWQLPKQAIPSLVTDKYPLPVGLNLPAYVTNRLDYQLMLNEQQPYLTTSIAGELTADSSDFNDITATDINANWSCNINAAGPDLAASLNAKCNIYSDIASVDMGPVVSGLNFSGLLSFADEQLQVVVDKASADVFSGTVSLSPLLITDFDHIVGQLHVRNLSLPEVLELYQVPGVKVTGLLKADLPFVVKGTAVSITDGTIEQQGEGGIIQIKDNVTIDQLKLTQPQLRYALELLENLHYDSLHSDVDFQPSGETKLTINIKGRNPSVARPIEFNYSHEENILQLFRSLRINDSLYDALDKVNNP